jgi:glutamate transport system substrate-binding protein
VIQPWTGKIFLCYRRHDTMHVVDRLYDLLGTRFPDSDIFLDRSTVREGADFVRVTEKAIRSADVVLVVIGEGWLGRRRWRRRIWCKDDHVRREVRTALEQAAPAGRPLIIPLLIDDAEMPLRRQLPLEIRHLVDLNARRVRADSFQDDVRKLSHAVVGQGESSKKRMPLSTTPIPLQGGPVAKVRRKSTVVIAFAMLLLAALTFGSRVFPDDAEREIPAPLPAPAPTPATAPALSSTTAPQASPTERVRVELDGSKTFDAMKARQRVVVGIKDDQPGLGLKDATGDSYSGFDIEIARRVADQLGFPPDKIDYRPVPSPNREDAIERGEVDFYVGTYTINNTRKKRVSFAGPYYHAGQSLLVSAHERVISGKGSLRGKEVCSVRRSSSLWRLEHAEQLTEPENVVALDSYAQCVDLLLAGKVRAVTTDDAILAGYAAQQPDKLVLVGQPFSVEDYGIGMAKDDVVLRSKINDILAAAAGDGTWKRIFNMTLAPSGITAAPPPIQRY